MRRLVALLIMFVLPLQFAWAAAIGIHGHAGPDVDAAGFHTHGHDHGASGEADHDHGGPSNGSVLDPADEGHQGHTHPVFFSLLPDTALSLSEVVPGGPIPPPPSRFPSRTPPLLDRPPLTLA